MEALFRFLIHVRTKGEAGTVKYGLSSPVIFSDRSKVGLLSGSFLLFIFHVYLSYALLSVPCSLLVTCLERADPLALMCVVFFVFLSFSHMVWYLIVSIPDR